MDPDRQNTSFPLRPLHCNGHAEELDIQFNPPTLPPLSLDCASFGQLNALIKRLRSTSDPGEGVERSSADVTSGDGGAGGHEGLIRRQSADNLLGQKGFASPGSTREEDRLTFPDLPK